MNVSSVAKATTTAALSLALVGPYTPTVGSTTAAAGICAGAQRCHVVAHKDVDGDGRADRVAWVKRTKKIAVVRVRTADGERLQRRINVSWWYGGGAWGGAARLDGRRGVELVVGSTMGAHTPGYTVLTYRRGGLVVHRSPRGEDHWYIDAAYSVAVGWWRHVERGRLTMTYKWATRTRHDTFRGANTTYVWRDGHWAKRRSVRTWYPNMNRAMRIAGWHVRGLAERPGL